MPRLINATPNYRKHSSGQAFVEIAGQRTYLGKHSTAASRQLYERLIGEWIAGGRTTITPTQTPTVAEIALAFIKAHATYYQRPDGTPTSELKNFKVAVRPMNRLYGRAQVTDFGPLALKAVREEMIRMGWARVSLNRQIGRIKHVFKWAVENELIPAGVFEALRAVSGLRAGRTPAKETDPILPVPQAYIDAAIPHLSRHVRGMVELQLLTGMRPGEVCAMRGIDIDTSGRLWTYTPRQHKTQHHGHRRSVQIGPRGQAVLMPFLKADTTAHIFSPAESERERREAMHAARTTPIAYGNAPGTNRKTSPRKAPGDAYTTSTYEHAVRAACDKADLIAKAGVVIGDDERLVPRWSPNRLRHNAATWLRKEFGLEAAQVILGHKTLTVTQVYAEKNVDAARKIMAEVG